jgi:hypothetical protein
MAAYLGGGEHAKSAQGHAQRLPYNHPKTVGNVGRRWVHALAWKFSFHPAALSRLEELIQLMR